MFIDLSHVSHKSMHDVLDVTKAPGKYIICHAVFARPVNTQLLDELLWYPELSRSR